MSNLPSSVPDVWCSFESSWLRRAELVQFEKSFAKSGFVSAATPSKFEVFRTVLCLSDESSADVYLGYGNFIGTTSVS